MASTTATISAATGSSTSAAAASSTAPNDLQAAILAFFQNRQQLSLYLVIPLIALLYAASCISYAVSRCRRKKVRAANRRRRMSAGDIEFVNAQAVRHGSESSLKSLLSRDRNRVAPDMTSAECRKSSFTNHKSEKARSGQTLDFVASNNSSDARERLAVGAVKLSAGGRENGEGKRYSGSTRFSDPSILAAIKEEPATAGKGGATGAALSNFRRSSYPERATDRATGVHRLGSSGAPDSAAAPATQLTDSERRSRSIPLQEHVEQALQSLKMNSGVDAPTGKDLRQAMKTVITLEMEVKSDPKAQEMIAKYRESKQRSRQTTINDSLKKGEWQKVPISDWIALKRAASEMESRPGSTVETSDASRY